MDDTSKSNLAPLFLLLLVAGVVTLGLFFFLSPGGPDAPDRPEPEPAGPIVPPEEGPPATGTGRVETPPRVPGRAVHGTVVDARGRPAPGATVSAYVGRAPYREVDLDEEEEKIRKAVADLFQYFPDEARELSPIGRPPSGPDPDHEPLATTTADGEGKFRFPRIVRGRVRLVARKDDLASRETKVSAGAPAMLVLGKTCSLEGFVRSAADGRKIEGATIEAVSPSRRVSTRSGEDGTFSFPNLPPGPVMLIASHPDYAGALKRGILLVPGRKESVGIQLTKGFRLTVVVRDFDSEKDPEDPVPHAEVAGIRLEDNGYFRGTADESGVAVFEGLPPGEYLLNARGKGFLICGEESVKIQEDTTHELLCERAVYTSVLVVDERDVPVPGASLWTGDPDEEFYEGVSRRVGRTNAEGRFDFPFEFDGNEAVLYVHKEGYGTGIAYPDDNTEGGTLKVRLPSGKLLRGVVRDAAGAPVEGARIYIEVIPVDDDAEDLYVSLFTNEKGEYRYPWLPPGEVWIEVEKEGWDGDDKDFEALPGGGREYVQNFRLNREE